MNLNKMMWLVVLILVSTTVGITLNSDGGNSYGNLLPFPQATPPGPQNATFADYDSPEPTDLAEREKRKRANQRYDKQGWVQRTPHPETGMIGRHTEEDPPPTIPTDESDLIVVGRIVAVATYLSNDKSGVYSEYKVKVEQVLKSDRSVELSPSSVVTVDRAGGIVRYPHGQDVIYQDSDKGLPEKGREYVLFLKNDDDTDNYSVITLYELQETITVPLDKGHSFDEIRRKGRSDFVRTIREKISQ